MKKYTRFVGLFLIMIGAMLLMATRFHGLSTHNSLLLSGLAAILLGIILHIHSIKHDSRY